LNNASERILSAACVMFAERGFSSVGIKSIARRARVNEATVYRKFGSKEGLFNQVYLRIHQFNFESIVPEAFTGDLPGDLIGIGLKVTEIMCRNARFYDTNMDEIKKFPAIENDLRKKPSSFMQSLSLYFSRAGERLRLRYPPEILAETYVQLLVNALLMICRSKGRGDLEGIIRVFCEIFARGMVVERPK
jgi:AcrR family transcriptional regulator